MKVPEKQLKRSFEVGKTSSLPAELTSHSPMLSWFLSWMSQSSWTLSAQWWMVRITGLVSRAPAGPQLTTGLNTVWMSSTGGLEKTDNGKVKRWKGVTGRLHCWLSFSVRFDERVGFTSVL